MKGKLLIFIALSLITVFAAPAKSQTANSNSSTQSAEEKIYKTDEVDQKAEITKIPKGRVTSECGTDKSSSGRVRIEMVLDKSGKVTRAELVEKSGCRYFNDRALEQAKKIKFKPAVKDGKAVSQYFNKSYEYNFFVVNRN